MNYYDEDDCGADTMEELFHGRDTYEAEFENTGMPDFEAIESRDEDDWEEDREDGWDADDWEDSETYEMDGGW
jgi:hypothetical protein